LNGHKELFHYTGRRGLEGILSSQVLWAIHASFLNDTSELRSFKQRLPAILQPPPYAGALAFSKNNRENRELVDREGGLDAVAERTATEIADGMYNALLGTDSSDAYIEPYVTSFCTTDNKQVSEHGLLSQWRGYGEDGGYAIVFDAECLDSLLTEEAQRWGGDLYGGDVVYSSDSDLKISAELGRHFDSLSKSIEGWLTSAGDPAALEPAYEALIQCACRYKHWGFSEEKEVRIIDIPLNKLAIAHQTSHGTTAPVKPRHSFVRGGITIPCIHLFEEITSIPDKPLPINRIIVGPHESRNDRRKQLETLMRNRGLNIPVFVSDIPYVGRR
jgi:hypothetical protein